MNPPSMPTWHSPLDPPFRVAGLAWFRKEGLLRRLPAKPPRPVSPRVELYSNCPAGVQIRFQTDSSRLHLRVRLRRGQDWFEQAATGHSGCDCYLGPPGRARYCSTSTFTDTRFHYECPMFTGFARAMRVVTLNLPLYQAVKQIHVGLDKDARIAAPPPYDDPRPIVIYGTSITQGGFASHPGMAWTNIVSRRINREIYNFGFAGSGRGEPEMAEILATIPDPAFFILDYEANSGGTKLLRKSFPRFIRILRRAHPHVPILAISKIRYAMELTDPGALKARLANRDVQRNTIRKLRGAGDRCVFFFDASKLLGDDFEDCSVDGGHPTDLGFLRMADGLTPVIRRLLGTIPGR